MIKNKHKLNYKECIKDLRVYLLKLFYTYYQSINRELELKNAIEIKEENKIKVPFSSYRNKSWKRKSKNNVNYRNPNKKRKLDNNGKNLKLSIDVDYQDQFKKGDGLL